MAVRLSGWSSGSTDIKSRTVIRRPPSLRRIHRLLIYRIVSELLSQFLRPSIGCLGAVFPVEASVPVQCSTANDRKGSAFISAAVTSSVEVFLDNHVTVWVA
jgi:hypothetical protein